MTIPKLQFSDQNISRIGFVCLQTNNNLWFIMRNSKTLPYNCIFPTGTLHLSTLHTLRIFFLDLSDRSTQIPLNASNKIAISTERSQIFIMH